MRFHNNLATNHLSSKTILMDRTTKLRAIRMSNDYEIHQDEMYYTSNSMNSSDTDSHSRDSSISSGYMTKMHEEVEVILPTNFVNLDGLHSGVPTRTTPTLTPTTLRNIEQTFIELQCEAESHQNRAGFVPPVVQPIIQGGSTYMSLIDSKGWQGGITSVSQSRSPAISNNNSHLTTTTTTRRNMGGRRPAKNTGISPEEEERRSVRRERNKMAAARCRKRRMDHTNSLLQETEGLEQKKQGLQTEIQQLQMQKEELEFLLEAHKACCRLNGSSSPPSPPDIKPFVFNGVEENRMEARAVKQETMAAPAIPLSQPTAAKRLMLSGGDAKPSRPTSLPVAAFPPSHNSLKTVVSVSEVAGIPITTPSSGIPFNFDSLMDGGTGLTPVSAPLVPSCSSQQRHSGLVDLSSPDGKLVSL